MITVGLDTYITVAEATDYIHSHYLSTDTRRAVWDNVTESDREVALRNACIHISGVLYRGIAWKASQPLPFPRYFGDNSRMIYRTLYTTDEFLYPEIKAVPKQVQWAQAEEAFEIIAPTESTEEYEAVNGPVKSYSIGHLSETYKDYAQGSIETEIVNKKAKALLRQFAEGGFDVL